MWDYAKGFSSPGLEMEYTSSEFNTISTARHHFVAVAHFRLEQVMLGVKSHKSKCR